MVGILAHPDYVDKEKIFSFDKNIHWLLMPKPAVARRAARRCAFLSSRLRVATV
jgi:hypothetical protein